jgi:hypothetical protein
MIALRGFVCLHNYTQYIVRIRIAGMFPTGTPQPVPSCFGHLRGNACKCQTVHSADTWNQFRQDSSVLCSTSVLEGLLHSDGIGNCRGMHACMAVPTLCSKLGHHMRWHHFGGAWGGHPEGGNGKLPSQCVPA